MRQFVFEGILEKDGSITLTGKNYRYLVNVLRLKTNDVIDVRLADGSLVPMELVSVEGKSVKLRKALNQKEGQESVTQGVRAEAVEKQMDSFTDMWLFQFLPRPQKMDLIVRQATECGVSTIVPIVGDFSQKSDSSPRIERWERIIKEARQQSGSPVPTKILAPCPVDKAAEIWKASTQDCTWEAFILHEDPAFGLPAGKSDKIEKAGLAVGAEGGFSQREFEILKEAGFKPLHFKTNVLRAETAALYGIAVVQQFLNR